MKINKEMLLNTKTKKNTLKLEVLEIKTEHLQLTQSYKIVILR